MCPDIKILKKIKYACNQETQFALPVVAIVAILEVWQLGRVTYSLSPQVNRTSCAQIHELPFLQLGNNREGELGFLITCILHSFF